IKEQIAGSGITIAAHENFVDTALPALKAWQADRRGLFLLQRRALVAQADENARGKRNAPRLRGVAKDARSARQLLTGGQVLYDAMGGTGGLVLECLFGSPYLWDLCASLLAQTARTASPALSYSVPVLKSLLPVRFPNAYRRRGVAFIHIPMNAG